MALAQQMINQKWGIYEEIATHYSGELQQ